MTLRLVVYHIKMNDSLKVIRKIFPFQKCYKNKRANNNNNKTNEIFIHPPILYLYMFFIIQIHIILKDAMKNMIQIHENHKL